MAVETILHSGSFNDYDGNEIKVTFYRRVDLNVRPSQIEFPVSGGEAYVTVWSNTGSACISDPAVSWLDYRQVGSEPIEGTNWYKYTYLITCDPASGGGSGRKTYTWNVYIEDGVGTGVVSTSFKVIQYLS